LTVDLSKKITLPATVIDGRGIILLFADNKELQALAAKSAGKGVIVTGFLVKVQLPSWHAVSVVPQPFPRTPAAAAWPPPGQSWPIDAIVVESLKTEDN
jgi:hypothetical protein